MAEKSGFHNAELVSGEYDRAYLAEDFANYFSVLVGNGFFVDYGDELVVTEAEAANMTVVLHTGRAFINGYWYDNDSAKALEIGVADSLLNRIDLVSIRYDVVGRTIAACVIPGVAASEPVEPAVVRNSSYYDLVVARVQVNAGVSAITQAMITDLRLDADYCGVVAGLVDQIDATSFFAQMNAALDAFLSDSSDEFDVWFDAVKGSLQGDPVGILTSHVANMSNPHGVTAAQVGAAGIDHEHGNITKDGKVGSVAGLPLFTGAGGLVESQALLAALAALGIGRATCSTSAGTTAKVGVLSGFVLNANGIVAVKFANANTEDNPTLNINSTGAKPIYYAGKSIYADMITAGLTAVFVYNGTQYELLNPALPSVGLLKGDGSGNAATAVEGTDYVGAASGKAIPDRISSAFLTVSSSATLALAHAGILLLANSASAIVLTIPANATVAFSVGTEIEILRYGAGTVTVAAAAGVTVRSAESKLAIDKQYMAAALKKIGTDEWLLVGALS